MHKEMDNIESKSEQELAERWVSLEADIYLMRKERREIEIELGLRLDMRDGRVIKVIKKNPIDNFTLERSFSPAYIQNRFMALRELLDEKDLNSVFVDEHYEAREPEYVPAKWLTGKLKKLAEDYGGEVKEIVEGAKAHSAIATAKFRLKRESNKEDFEDDDEA